MKPIVAALILACLANTPAGAETRIRIMPPGDAVFAAGQRFDIRVEAASDAGDPPRGLRVFVNGRDVTARNVLKAGSEADAPAGSTNVLLRGFSLDTPGRAVIEARTEDGATAASHVTVEAWDGRAAAPRARNVILLLGDGMGAAQRTAARLVSRGVRNGKAAGRLAMDTLEVTGLVMTPSLNSVITDSSPGMAAYASGQKSQNNQQGVFPDNTPDPFDNPRVEYVGELLRRIRGTGFNVGLVTTSDVTDSTPAANAIHTSDRNAGAGIAARFLDERDRHGVTVLLGGGRRHFAPKPQGTRRDGRRLEEEFAAAGFAVVSSGREVQALLGGGAPPERVLGLFHPAHLPVAFDKVGAGRYSDELALARNAAWRDTPMLEDLARLAIRSLAAHSPEGFYLMIEGASIDKRGHAVDAERTIWDVIELDRAVQVALDFAALTNEDDDPENDTLVIVTADHEVGGMAIVGVGNERYAPAALGRAVRDYAAVFRFEREQELVFVPNYTVDERGYPTDPDPSRKLLIGWAAAPDRRENWISNRLQREAAVETGGTPEVSVANPARDGDDPSSDNRTVDGVPIPGFHVTGVIENGATSCPATDGCPDDTASDSLTISGHTATDVPLSASGPGAWQFTGVYENTDVFLKILRSTAGTYGQRPR